MRTLRAIVPTMFVLILAWPAQSQEYHQWELFGGFDYLHLGAGTVGFTGVPSTNLQNSYGWHITATENKAAWIGGIVDVSGDYVNRTINFGTPAVPFNMRLNGQAYPVLFGPRFYYRKLGGLTLFGEPTIGLAVARITIASAAGIPGVLPSTQVKWAYAFGGGADYDLSDRFAIRAQADWIRTHFPQTLAQDFQNNYRISGGIVFKFR